MFLVWIFLTFYFTFNTESALPPFRGLEEEFNAVANRNKRYLLFPPGSAWGLFLAFGIPLDLPNQDVLFSWALETDFDVITDVSELRPAERSLSSFNRTFIYGLIKDRFESHGSNGHQCLLQMICDVARSPVDHSGLVGGLLQDILTPSSSVDEGLYEEARAEAYGKNHVWECPKLYPKCETNVLDFISKVVEQ